VFGNVSNDEQGQNTKEESRDKVVGRNNLITRRGNHKYIEHRVYIANTSLYTKVREYPWTVYKSKIKISKIRGKID